MKNVNIYTRHSQGTFIEMPRCLMVGSVEASLSALGYYRGPDCGYTDAFATVQDLCETCNGQGTVALKRRPFARRTCPTCKGVESPEMYASIADLARLKWAGHP